MLHAHGARSLCVVCAVRCTVHSSPWWHMSGGACADPSAATLGLLVLKGLPEAVWRADFGHDVRFEVEAQLTKITPVVCSHEPLKGVCDGGWARGARGAHHGVCGPHGAHGGVYSGRCWHGGWVSSDNRCTG